MSRIHVNRDRQNLGQFSPEEVTAGLASGRFLPTDLAWREGMETWQPLSAFDGLPAPSAEAIEEPVPALAPGSPINDLERLPAAAPKWESDPAAPLFTRLYETIREVLGSPQATFAGMPVTGGIARPLQFLLILATVCGLVSMGYQFAFELLVPKPAAGAERLTPAMMAVVYGVVAVLLPLMIAAASFISAGIMHVSLMCVGGNPKSFEATYRVVAYANGATSVMMLIPFCGGLIQGIWNLVLLAIGFREVHGLSTGKAVVAVLLPIFLCCGVVFLAAFGLGLALPAAFQR